MALLDQMLDIWVRPISILTYTIELLVALAIVYLAQNEVVRYRARIRNLPGPRGWPVVGNLFQVVQRDSLPS